jgi:hypothetical protein
VSKVDVFKDELQYLGSGANNQDPFLFIKSNQKVWAYPGFLEECLVLATFDCPINPNQILKIDRKIIISMVNDHQYPITFEDLDISVRRMLSMIAAKDKKSL